MSRLWDRLYCGKDNEFYWWYGDEGESGNPSPDSFNGTFYSTSCPEWGDRGCWCVPFQSVEWWSAYSRLCPDEYGAEEYWDECVDYPEFEPYVFAYPLIEASLRTFWTNGFERQWITLWVQDPMPDSTTLLRAQFIEKEITQENCGDSIVWTAADYLGDEYYDYFGDAADGCQGYPCGECSANWYGLEHLRITATPVYGNAPGLSGVNGIHVSPPVATPGSMEIVTASIRSDQPVEWSLVGPDIGLDEVSYSHDGDGTYWVKYPYACTSEGGTGAWVGHVPTDQQSAQGKLISDLIREHRLKPGDKFEVKVINYR